MENNHACSCRNHNNVLKVDSFFAKKNEAFSLKYASENASGFDLVANIDKPITLKRFERSLVLTGLFLALPIGFEAQIRPRSGLALKKGVTVLNSPGTIDADYRGEIGVILINFGEEDFVINPGDRIAQCVICSVQKVELVDVPYEELGKTERGDGGYGHTGV